MVGAGLVVGHATVRGATTTTETPFTTNGTWTVPAGVSRISVVAFGGQGGNGGNDGVGPSAGGFGARVTATDVAVSPGDVLAITLGGKGGDGFADTDGSGSVIPGPGGTNGGGDGGPGGGFGTSGGGGGGSTTVVDTTAASTLVVAGGGGGGGGGVTAGGDGGSGDENGLPGTNGDPTFNGRGGSCGASTCTPTPGAGGPVDGGSATGATGGGGSSSGGIVASDIDAGNGGNGKVTISSTTSLLTVNKAGSGAGSVVSEPAGIECDAACPGPASADFTTGVVLTAIPASGSVFSGWSGGGCPGTGTCSPNLDSSDQSVTATFTPLSGGGSAPPTSDPSGPSGPQADTSPPETTITGGPLKSKKTTSIRGADSGLAKTRDRTPNFSFTSSEANSTFQCSVDGGAYASCSSPFTTAKLKRGEHTFSVRAIDADGNADPTPAFIEFKVKKKKR